MKIRNGFVTNSSSSSFIASIKKPSYDEMKYGEGVIRFVSSDYELQNLQDLFEYGDAYGATIETVMNQEELYDILDRDDYDDVKWLLNYFLDESTHDVESLKALLKDNYLLIIDADRSNASGCFLKLIDDYIELKKIGETLYYYGD